MRRMWLLLGAIAFPVACTSVTPAITEADRTAIADSAAAVLRAVWDGGMALDADRVYRDFTRDPDGRFVGDGVMTALDTLIAGSAAEYGMFESLSVSPVSLDAIVLARDAVALTAPCDFSFKTKAGVSYTGRAMITAVVQRRGTAWQIVQWHASHVNVPEIMAAMEGTPPKN